MTNDTEQRLSMEQIGKGCPRCPRCKEPLVARRPDRRFIENDNYAECIRGHIWELTRVDDK